MKHFWNKNKKNKAIFVLTTACAIGLVSILFKNEEKQEQEHYVFSKGEDLQLPLDHHNNKAALDQITNQAIEDLECGDDEENHQIVNDGLYFIHAHLQEFKEQNADNETMEKALYYAYFMYSFIAEESDMRELSDLSEAERAAYESGYHAYLYLQALYQNKQGAISSHLDIVEHALKVIEERSQAN